MDNIVAQEYFCNLDMNGRRLDIDQRPELLFGSVDWVATKEYCARDPKPCNFLFCIDVTYTAIVSGMLFKFVESLKETLFSIGLPPAVKIGIMTFDRAVHFYNLKSTLDQPQMMVVSDINDVFVPLHDGLFVDPIASRTVIESLLDSLVNLFEASRINEPALGAAVQAAHMAMVN